jgi:hypothetical protein
MENIKEIQMLEFDRNFLENQVFQCKFFIDNGCWDGYSENLIVRKEQLKELRKELREIEIKIFELKNTNPF